MKHAFAIVCCFLLLLGLCACNNKKQDTVLDVVGKEDVDQDLEDESEDVQSGTDKEDIEDSNPDNLDDGTSETKDPVVEIPIKEDTTEQSDEEAAGTEETGETEVFVPGQVELPYAVDLNGDGIEEDIHLEQIDFGELTGCYRLVVRYGDTELKADTYIRDFVSVWLGDLEGDGEKEIFISGDFASQNYITYAYRLRDGQLIPVAFDDRNLWPDRESEYSYVFGKICGISEEGLELMETFDLLGSYEGLIRFLPSEDGYILGTDTISFVENEYVLKTKVELPVTYQNEDVEADGMLGAGQQLLITGMDISRQRAYFETADGAKGYFILTRSDGGFSYQIGELDEFACFESLPYAG